MYRFFSLISSLFDVEDQMRRKQNKEIGHLRSSKQQNKHPKRVKDLDAETVLVYCVFPLAALLLVGG